MSGPFGSSQWMYSSGFYPYEIGQSLRFNDDDSAYLSRTPASAGNRKTWTWSGWVKRGNLNSLDALFGTGNSPGVNYTFIRITADNKIGWQYYDGATNNVWQSDAVLRDPSAWYHIVGAVDTTQATAADRFKIYVNGVQLTAGSFVVGTWPTLNSDMFVNSTVPHYHGRADGTDLFDGYMAEVNFIDGQALDPTSFGQFKSGVWVPKAYTGSYGTNGFYLPFSDSAAIGDDLSGNGNDWTPSGLASTDVMLDSPTNNYATLNTAVATGTISEGNLKQVASVAGVNQYAWANFGNISAGKWYLETRLINGGGSIGGTLAWLPSAFGTANGSFSGGTGIYWNSAGLVAVLDGSASGTLASGSTGDIIGIAVDFDAKTLTIYSNGTQVYTNSFVSVGAFALTAYAYVNTTTVGQTLNFGQDSSFSGTVTRQGNTDANGRGDFYYAPPTGYLALCAANLPDPEINPAVDDVPEDYFNTVIWTGDDTTRDIFGIAFQPDLTWVKARSSAQSHVLYDAVRGPGANKDLTTNSSASEGATSGGLFGDVTAFLLDGFTVAPGSTNAAFVNLSGQTYVAWNWLAGNGTSANTDGTISSAVSVNQKAGFSIVSWEAQATGVTVGHGLGAAPELIIMKDRDGVLSWLVYHEANGPDGFLFLNDTAAFTSNLTVFSDAPTATVFSPGTGVITGNGYASQIAYCFAEVEGYSKFGSYTGNGSTDGPFVWTGFRPAFVMVKRTDSTGNWLIKDAVRDPTNEAGRTLLPDVSDAEYGPANTPFDLLSNGFKLRTTSAIANASGGTYIFAAFSQMPFKYSLGR